MKLNTLVRFLNKELRVKAIEDSSRNGLQVRGRKEVKKIGIGVDACMDVFKKAKQQNCDAVLVHHGLIWNKKKTDKKTKERRISYLKKNKMSLLGYHLPLDIHRKYGNNSLIMDFLGTKEKKRFAKFGFKGCFERPVEIRKLVNRINKEMKTKSHCLLFGKKKVRTIGVVSGSWKEGVMTAINNNLDVYLAGEIQNVYPLTKENNINVIFAGHYATETFGVRAVGKLLKDRFGLKIVFIHNPTRI